MVQLINHPMDFQSTSAILELKDQLNAFNITNCPYLTFEAWYKKSAPTETNLDAMSVATVDAMGIPRNRYILFKGIVNSKFVFYTNYLSQKAQDISENEMVSLNFFWPSTKYQVRITGKAKKAEKEFNQKYFESRDRESQLASAMSHQSSTIESRDELVRRVQELSEKFPSVVPCPENWGGFLIEPMEFEFFIYGAFRLNDRFLFVNNGTNWILKRLQP